MKSRRPFAPMIRISRGPASTEVLPAAAGSAVSQLSPTASSTAKPDRGQGRDTTIRLSAGRLRRNGLRRHGPGAAQHAGHATDQGVGPGETVGVVPPEPAYGPAQYLGADILSAGEEVVVANLMQAGRHCVPLVRGSRQRLLHELVPDGRGAHDTGRVVAQRAVVGVPDPDRRGQAGCKADRPVVAEGLGGSGSGSDMATGQGEVGMAAELHAAIAVRRYDRRHDEGDLLADGAG